MTYQVMARKWRPQDFDQVIAQEHVTRTLQNAIRSERIGHAYLFSGPRGVGKTTVARILAKAINCQEGPTPTPCNKCTACQEITGSRSLDVLEIDGASNRRIEDIRELRENVKYSPVGGKYKIIIIDEVHQLTPEAFNALLKTLEEPPSHVVFIFATTQPQKIPLTILSRCQRFDFRRIPTKLIAQRLSYITEQEKLQVEESALNLLAKKAEGSLRDGQSLLDQLISFGGNNITVDEVSEVLGLASRDLFFELIDVVCDRNSKKGLELVATVEAQGWDMEEFIDGLLDHLRHLLLAKTAPESPELMDLIHADRERYTEQGAKVEEEDLLRMVAVVSDTSSAIRYNSQPRFLMEMMVVKLAKMEATVHLKELMQGLNRVLGEGGGGKPGVESPEHMDTEKTAGRPSTPPQAELDGEAHELWKQMLTRVRKKKSSLGAILQHGQLAELQNQSLTIVFPKSCNFHLIQAEKQKNRAVIEGEASNILGKDIQVKFTMARLPESSEKPKALATPPGRKLSAEEVVKAEPIVGTILETMDGELIE
jgi:DNA polymerase-3 subunit gamma/tau